MLKKYERMCACGCGGIINLKESNYVVRENGRRNRYYFIQDYKMDYVNKINRKLDEKYRFRNIGEFEEYYEQQIKDGTIKEVSNESKGV